MNIAEQLVDALLEGDDLPDSQMLGTRKERTMLNKLRHRRRVELSQQGRGAEADPEWEQRAGHAFKHAVQTDPEIRKRYGLGESMPDWLKKKISGKAEDGDGKDGDGKDDSNADDGEKSSNGEGKPSSNVAAACGPSPGKVTNSI